MRLTDADYDSWLGEPYQQHYAREEQFDRLVHQWAQMVKDEMLYDVWVAMDLLARRDLKVGSFHWKVREMLENDLEAELSDQDAYTDEEFAAYDGSAMPPYEAMVKAVAALRDRIEDDEYFSDAMRDIERDLDRNPDVD